MASVGGRRLGWSKSLPGDLHVLRRTDATQSRPYPNTRLTKGGQPYLMQVSAVGGWMRQQRETGDRIIGGGYLFRSRVSAVRCLVRVSRFRFGARV